MRRPHHDYHICLLSELTGSKLGGNGAALISFPQTTHRHLVTSTRTQNLCKNSELKKRKKKEIEIEAFGQLNGGFDLVASILFDFFFSL